MRTHRFEPASLIFGLLFAVIGMVFLNGETTLWNINWAWFWPVALTVAGLVVLMSARPRRDSDETEPLSPADDE